jgi:hypothetical protein
MLGHFAMRYRAAQLVPCGGALFLFDFIIGFNVHDFAVS